ncbi:hypothetical protein B0J12DRAFT_224058 [Macrophomina phaseolina]|uniref:C2H2-type domain-containing protein n=1 Tax=Macrophomina phaseolina TaxID=35725 RepID=A0ABQ8GPF2_9PEZI|nr:hypothetical protein B0J12DRAFT_224058 [Macrophomina phaseolina]
MVGSSRLSCSDICQPSQVGYTSLSRSEHNALCRQRELSFKGTRFEVENRLRAYDFDRKHKIPAKRSLQNGNLPELFTKRPKSTTTSTANVQEHQPSLRTFESTLAAKPKNKDEEVACLGSSISAASTSSEFAMPGSNSEATSSFKAQAQIRPYFSTSVGSSTVVSDKSYRGHGNTPRGLDAHLFNHSEPQKLQGIEHDLGRPLEDLLAEDKDIDDNGVEEDHDLKLPTILSSTTATFIRKSGPYNFDKQNSALEPAAPRSKVMYAGTAFETIVPQTISTPHFRKLPLPAALSSAPNDTTASATPKLSRVVAIGRMSNMPRGDVRQEWFDKLLPQCEQLIDFYLKKCHNPICPDCQCSFDTYSVAFVKLSSNINFATSNSKYIRGFREALSVPGHVVLCGMNLDGHTTNMEGFFQLFFNLADRGTQLSMMVWVDNDRFSTYSHDSIIHAYNLLRSGKRSPDDTYLFFMRMVQCSLSKNSIAHARRVAKQLMPDTRNWRPIDPSVTSENSGIFGTNGVEYVKDEAEKRSRFKIAAETRRNAVKVFTPQMHTNGQLICPETSCSYKADREDQLVAHLVKRALRWDGKSICSLCGAEIKSLKVHIICHFPAKLQCPEPGCTELFKSKQSVDSHVKKYHNKIKDEVK